jgi:hypothetical protein
MKVRRIDSDGDMMFGHGAADYLQDTPEAVAQNVKTRLGLWRGQWFLDTTEGTLWMQEILGKNEAVETIIRSRILGTPGVLEITSFESVFDPDARALSVTATINTKYGETTVEETIS